MLEIKKTLTQSPKQKPDQSNLGFGKYFSDHMVTVDYSDDKGWHNAQLVPYGPICLDPAAMVFHYGQELFEGMKAYPAADGRVLLFRPEKNAERMIRSCERMCMALLPTEDFIQCVEALVNADRDWIPTAPGTSLYLRPFIIATDAMLGVHASHTYKAVFIASPTGSYYPNGFAPIRIFVEDEYTRASRGGTGYAKCGGNYGGSLKAQEKAQELGYNQVLWLDSVEQKYVEEVGAMNMMFKIDGEIITAPLDGTILPGVTRDSCLQLLRDWGCKVSERKLSVDELIGAAHSGKLEEAFGCGTAAVISPVGEICYKGEKHVINNFEIGEISQKLYDNLTGIQWGRLPDPHGWTREVT